MSLKKSLNYLSGFQVQNAFWTASWRNLFLPSPRQWISSMLQTLSRDRGHNPVGRKRALIGTGEQPSGSVFGCWCICQTSEVSIILDRGFDILFLAEIYISTGQTLGIYSVLIANSSLWIRKYTAWLNEQDGISHYSSFMNRVYWCLIMQGSIQ